MLREGVLRLDPEAPRPEAYDPWESYGLHDEPLPERAPHEVPYHRLGQLDLANSAEVVAFTRRWGLLGVMQHNLVEARYVPSPRGWTRPWSDPNYPGIPEITEAPGFRARGGDDDPRFDEVERGDRSFLTLQFGAVGWLTFDEAATPQLHEQELERLNPDDTVGFDHALDGLCDAVATVLVRQETGDIARLSLEHYFSRYLPNAPLDHPPCQPGERHYPSIHGPDFWPYLCEPLQEFVEAAELFQIAFNLALDAPNEPARRRLASEVHRGLASTRPVLAPRETGKWELRWFCPSLLAACYLMLLTDLTEDRQLRRCAARDCRQAFRARVGRGRSRQRLFCSKPCKNREMQARLRDRARE